MEETFEAAKSARLPFRNAFISDSLKLLERRCKNLRVDLRLGCDLPLIGGHRSDPSSFKLLDLLSCGLAFRGLIKLDLEDLELERILLCFFSFKSANDFLFLVRPCLLSGKLLDRWYSGSLELLFLSDSGGDLLLVKSRLEGAVGGSGKLVDR